MVVKPLNKKNNIQSFISLIFIFIFSFVNFFYLIQLEVIQGTVDTMPPASQQTVSLSSVLKNNQLGEISIKGDTPTQNEIIEAVKDKNPALKQTNLEIVGTIGDAKSKVKSSSNEYNGEIEVTYSAKKTTLNKLSLKDVLEHHQLGEISIKGDKPTEDEIIEAVKVKNPALKQKKLKIFGTIGDAKSKVKSSSNEYNGEIEVTYSAKKTTLNKLSLKDVLEHHQLGEISIKGDTPTQNEIIEAVKDKNPALKQTNLEIVGIIGDTKTRVKSSSNEYNGEIEVTYSAKKTTLNKPNLKDVLEHHQLGEISIKGDKPTEDEIIEAVKVKNPALKQKKLKIVGTIGDAKSKVKSISNEYNGEIEVTYSAKKTNNSFNIWLFSIILSIILATLALVGYYFYKKNNNVAE